MALTPQAMATASDGIDATATGNWSVEHIPENVYGYVPTACYVMLQGVSGTLVSVATISVGTNAPDYNNIVPATLLSGIEQVDAMHTFVLSGNGTMIPGDTSSVEIFLRVSSGAVATTYTLAAIVCGYVVTES